MTSAGVGSGETSQVSKSVNKCYLCSGPHRLWYCSDFKSKSVAERVRIVKEKRLCFSCLQSGHGVRECKRSKPCGLNGCQRKHNSMLRGA